MALTASCFENFKIVSQDFDIFLPSDLNLPAIRPEQCDSCKTWASMFNIVLLVSGFLVLCSGLHRLNNFTALLKMKKQMRGEFLPAISALSRSLFHKQGLKKLSDIANVTVGQNCAESISIGIPLPIWRHYTASVLNDWTRYQQKVTLRL